MTTKLGFIPAVLLTALLLTGCGQNPLIGEWVQPKKSMFSCNVVKFTADREFCDSASSQVSYEVSQSSVLVKSKNQSALIALDMTYSVISENVISYVDPFSQEKVFLYRKGTSPVSKNAIKYSEQYTLPELEKACESGPATVTHPSKYWSETLPKIINEDFCTAAELKRNS